MDIVKETKITCDKLFNNGNELAMVNGISKDDTLEINNQLCYEYITNILGNKNILSTITGLQTIQLIDLRNEYKGD